VAVDGDCVGEVTDKEKGLTGGAHLLEGGGSGFERAGRGAWARIGPAKEGEGLFLFLFIFSFLFA
jgi:hypothetical protein